MPFSEFSSSAEARQRYWARSYQGWRRIGQAQPNTGHRALAGLESSGLRGAISQKRGRAAPGGDTKRVICLHGDIGRRYAWT
jgi:NAD-dependent SIR2 family protein deacetylase